MDDLIALNQSIQKSFNVKAGIEKHGLLNSIVERPDQGYYGKTPYPDIYSKAASIFESIARWHVFSDLNKRTALIATRSFLDVNGYFFIVPLSAVKFSVKVADDRNTDDEYTAKLIVKIASWIKKYSANKQDLLQLKTALKNCAKEYLLLDLFFRLKLSPIAEFFINRWLAVNVYPEYKMTREEIMDYIFEMNKETKKQYDSLFPH
jgi:death-on-curing protein